MPRYEITSPDGRKFEVTAPEGASQAEVLAYAQKNFGSQPAASAPDFGNVTGSDGRTMAQREQAAQVPVSDKSGTRRGLELGLRSTLQGAGSLLGAVGGDAFNAYIVDPIRNALHSPTMSDLVTGNTHVQPSPSYRELGGQVADMIGLERPYDSRERVLGDVGEALTGTGLTMGIGGLANTAANAGMKFLAPLGEFLTAQPGAQVASTAMGSGAGSVVRENGGGPGAQLAATLVGGLAPASLAGGSAAVRGMARGRSGEGVQQTINDFAELGATPSVGQATGNRLLQGAENTLGGLPTSAGVVHRFVSKQADDIGEGLKTKAGSISPNPSGERAGRAIEKGVETFRGNVAAQRKALYWQADQRIPSDTPTALSNTWQEVVRLTSPDPSAAATTAAMVSPKIANLRQTLEQDLAAGGGTVSYEALKRIRSDVGEAISDFSLTPDASTREMKALYAALSRDMEEAAKSQGPEAVAAARRANNYTRASSERLETLNRVVDKNGGPEAVFNAALAGTKDGATTLRAVMRSLPDVGQKKAFTAAVLKRMGMATPGQQDAAGEAFSAASFLTNWSKLSPEARSTLFYGYGPKFADDMDQIARVAENIKAGSKVMANPSGTANRAASIGYAGALVASLFDPSHGALATLVGSGLAANAAARILTSPRIVSWLARETTKPHGSAIGAINALRVIGQNYGDEDAVMLAKELKDAEEAKSAKSDGG